MFDINSKYKIDDDIPIISDNYQLIHFDEVPILFCGTNEYEQIIMGSLCGESEDGETFRYFHSVIKNLDYVRFIKNKISYRQLLETIKRIYIIDKDVNNNISSIYHVPLGEIPQEALPLPNIFCPDTEVIFGSEFIVSLKGGLAAMHEAIPKTVTIISKNATQFLTTIADTFKIGNLNTEITEYAPAATSFGLTFKVKFNSIDLFFNNNAKKALNDYFGNVIDYSLNHLSGEAKQLKTNVLDNTKYQEMVLTTFDNAYNALSQKLDNESKERLRKNIIKIPFELEKITDQLGQGFEYLEMKSHNTITNTTTTIGILNNEFSKELATATHIIETEGELVDEDDVFKTYTIHVYHLNKITRKGNAHINHKNAYGKDILDSPKFSIQGEAGLTGSVFIDSMDTGSWIEVSAKAKKVNGRFKSLKIAFD